MVLDETPDYRGTPGRDGNERPSSSSSIGSGGGGSSGTFGSSGNSSSGGSGLGLSTLGSGLSRAKEKVEGVAARMKRIAISAEPSKKVANPRDLNITRIEKGEA